MDEIEELHKKFTAYVNQPHSLLRSEHSRAFGAGGAATFDLIYTLIAKGVEPAAAIAQALEITRSFVRNLVDEQEE